MSTESYKILVNKTPYLIHDMFKRSVKSIRIILPKFKYERYKSNSFIFNSSKTVNHVLAYGIDIYAMSQATLKIYMKRYLMTKQSATLHSDPNWYPCNLSIFSDVNF